MNVLQRLLRNTRSTRQWGGGHVTFRNIGAGGYGDISALTSALFSLASEFAEGAPVGACPAMTRAPRRTDGLGQSGESKSKLLQIS